MIKNRRQKKEQNGNNISYALINLSLFVKLTSTPWFRALSTAEASSVSLSIQPPEGWSFHLAFYSYKHLTWRWRRKPWNWIENTKGKRSHCFLSWSTEEFNSRSFIVCDLNTFSRRKISATIQLFMTVFSFSIKQRSCTIRVPLCATGHQLFIV